MRADELFHVLDSVQGQIRFFDTKAQIVLGIDGILAGFLSSQTSTLVSRISGGWPGARAIGLAIVCAGYLFSLILSLAWAFKTVYPRLQVNQPRSKIFFAHIAEQYEDNYGHARSDLIGMSEDELRADVTNQIVANSLVCKKKHYCLEKALLWMGISIVLWVGALLLLFAMTLGQIPK